MKFPLFYYSKIYRKEVCLKYTYLISIFSSSIFRSENQRVESVSMSTLVAIDTHKIERASVLYS